MPDPLVAASSQDRLPAGGPVRDVSVEAPPSDQPPLLPGQVDLFDMLPDELLDG